MDRGAAATGQGSAPSLTSIPVVPRLVWPFDRPAEIVGLFLRKLGELHANAFEAKGSTRASRVAVDASSTAGVRDEASRTAAGAAALPISS